MALTKVKGSGLATGAATDNLVGIDDNATSTAITIDASENVGIGITPTVPLQIRKRLSSVGQSTPETVLLLETDAGSGDMSAGNGTRILFKIADDETNPSVGASIDAVRANGDDSISSTDLVFSTSQNDETLDEALRITSDGRGLSQFTAKAWVSVNMTTPGLLDSFNISSYVDEAVGQFTVNFTSNPAHANYSISGSTKSGYIMGYSHNATSSFRVRNGDSNWSGADTDGVCATVFGD